LFGLSIAAALYFAGGGLRRSSAVAFVPVVCGLLMVYVTALHAVFQAEPRYSIPYRPEQLVITCVAIAAIVARLARWRALPRAGALPAQAVAPAVDRLDSSSP
jgi:hypothetical protein